MTVEMDFAGGNISHHPQPFAIIIHLRGNDVKSKGRVNGLVKKIEGDLQWMGEHAHSFSQIINRPSWRGHRVKHAQEFNEECSKALCEIGGFAYYHCVLEKSLGPTLI